MSQHVVVQNQKKYVFGWDQPLMSFFLQVHDLNISDPDDQIIVWDGATPDSQMYEVEHLVQAASEHGLNIGHAVRLDLYDEKDHGR